MRSVHLTATAVSSGIGAALAAVGDRGSGAVVFGSLSGGGTDAGAPPPAGRFLQVGQVGRREDFADPGQAGFFLADDAGEQVEPFLQLLHDCLRDELLYKYSVVGRLSDNCSFVQYFVVARPGVGLSPSHLP